MFHPTVPLPRVLPMSLAVAHFVGTPGSNEEVRSSGRDWKGGRCPVGLEYRIRVKGQEVLRHRGRLRMTRLLVKSAKVPSFFLSSLLLQLLVRLNDSHSLSLHHHLQHRIISSLDLSPFLALLTPFSLLPFLIYLLPPLLPGSSFLVFWHLRLSYLGSLFPQRLLRCGGHQTCLPSTCHGVHVAEVRRTVHSLSKLNFLDVLKGELGVLLI